MLIYKLMKLFYLILLGALYSLPMKANFPEFADRHPMTLKGEIEISSTKKANIQKVTEEAKATLLSKPSKAYEQHSGYSMEGEWLFKMYGYFLDTNMNVNFYGMLVGDTFLMVIPSNWTRDGDAFPGLYEKTELSATTTPALVSWGRNPIDVTIRNIHEDAKSYINFIVGDDDITTGLEEITSLEDNPRYFKLQGIEVLNPVKGQILIEKRGDSVRKVVI